MTLKILLSSFLALLITGCVAKFQRIYLIPTLHGLHKTNTKYNYDSLKQIIAALDPDIIAVEIRAEDINQDSAYLSKNYPFEMYMMKSWFPQATIRGFDWLGNDIEGKSIPAGYWKEISPIKKYERALDADSTFSVRTAACDSFTNQRLHILKNYSLKQILKSEDAALTNKFYACLNEQLKGSIHERILHFNNQRNSRLLENIRRIIAENKGKTIVILTGDDHYAYLENKFPNKGIYE